MKQPETKGLPVFAWQSIPAEWRKGLEAVAADHPLAPAPGRRGDWNEPMKSSKRQNVLALAGRGIDGEERLAPRKTLFRLALASVTWCSLLAAAHGMGDGRARSSQRGEPVDEPLGARYTLGMTLWHMGHNADSIAKFHDYAKQQGLTPAKLLPAKSLKPPATATRVLVEPERLGPDRLGGWSVDGECITSGAGDKGPTVSIPVHVPRGGLYRLWVPYYANKNCIGVAFLKIYRAGQEAQGPICQPDEVYDTAATQAGFAWHDLLVDLPAGDQVIQLGHVTRLWQGDGAHDIRRVDCLYLTDELWAAPPDAAARQAMRDTKPSDGIQWTLTPPLADTQAWKWWQVRPLSWEDAASNPKLFALSREFWKGAVDALAKKEYQEKEKPDYRAPERQVVYNETWNMVANPVRAQRQIDTLSADVSRQPLGYHYVWHDVGGHIDGLKPDGNYKDTPYATYGGWYGGPGGLGASWGNGSGTVTTHVPVTAPGRYAVWVLSYFVNLHYTAPWFGTVTADGQAPIKYHHQGKIPSVWMKMGEVTVEKPGKVRVDFTLDDAGYGGTYRNIHTLFLVDDPKFVPSGTVRPPWTMEMFRQRAAQAGARPKDSLLLWLADDPYRPFSQEVWAEKIGAGDGWPYAPVTGTRRAKDLLMARDTCRAVQVGLRNLTDAPLALDVRPGPLKGQGGRFPGAVTWRAEAFIPYGDDRQAWTPFFLMRRPNITVPPLNVAGVWLNVDTHGVPAGEYVAAVTFRGQDIPVHTVQLKVRVAALAPTPKQPVLLDGWSQPHEGEAYMRDFVEHGMNVLQGEMSKADMQKWGIRLLSLGMWSPDGVAEAVARWKALGLDYSDYFVSIMDEPGGTTEEALKPYLDAGKAIRAADPNVRISFNPSEAAELATFQVLAPYADVWCPYSKHVFSPHYGNPEKKKIYEPKPWMWYSTPCLGDKTAREPGIRTMPSQPGNCVGVAFFALNYPGRDQWDTGYEHIPDNSTMGAVMSRHGPVATIMWEQIREASQTANLAMMVRERLGATRFEDVREPALQKLIAEGSSEDLILWLEQHPDPAGKASEREECH